MFRYFVLIFLCISIFLGPVSGNESAKFYEKFKVISFAAHLIEEGIEEKGESLRESFIFALEKYHGKNISMESKDIVMKVLGIIDKKREAWSECKTFTNRANYTYEACFSGGWYHKKGTLVVETVCDDFPFVTDCKEKKLQRMLIKNLVGKNLLESEFAVSCKAVSEGNSDLYSAYSYNSYRDGVREENYSMIEGKGKSMKIGERIDYHGLAGKPVDVSFQKIPVVLGGGHGPICAPMNINHLEIYEAS